MHIARVAAARKNTRAHATPIAALLILLASPAGAQPDSAASESAGAQPAATVESLHEQVQILQTDMDNLKRFKFSGYVQARWERLENQSDTVRVTGSPATFTPANSERFFIRRGRLKLTYDAHPLSQAVVYLDGASSGASINVRLLEAYVAILDPWTPDHRHQLWLGQMNVPFGYELERSSSVRELPERSRAENVLFNGERDRGVKLVLPWTPRFETVVGLMNGGGISDAQFPTTDPTHGKDLVARARYSTGTVDVAASWYGGRALIPLTGPDVQTDRTRFGADAQLYYALPVVGGGSLKGEMYRGVNPNADSLRVLIVPPSSANPVTLLAPGADPAHLATDFLGWYVMAVQNLGEKLQFAARWERWDPNEDRSADQFERASFGLNWFYDSYTRITLAYDMPRTQVAATGGGFRDPSDNLLTVQLQHRF